MLYRVTGILTSTTGEERAATWLIDATPPVAPDSCAAVVLAHLHAEPSTRRWWWKTPPAVVSLGTTQARPGEWFIPDDCPADLLAFLAPPPGADASCVMHLLVHGDVAESVIVPLDAVRFRPDTWQVLLDMEGPLCHPIPTAGVNRTGATRSALLQLLAQCGDWITQLGHLLDTLSLDDLSPDDLRREEVVLDHLEHVVALYRARVAARQPHHALGA